VPGGPNIDKLKIHSPDLVQENVARIADIFPGCVTEVAGTDGATKLAIDFDLLRQELSDSIVEGPQERYHLNWPGKREALLTANAPIAKTLRPCREESVNFETTRNLFIEGDNLDVLKLLQETYLGKVKLIYIDPPYNTGTNLIYKNDYSMNETAYMQISGQLLADGGKLTANPQTCGRFHSDWLTMIYSRLKVAKNLLSAEGVLVVAIDENEFSNLSNVIEEIFGEGSYNHDYVSVVHNPRGQQGTNFNYVNKYLIFIYPKNMKTYLADFKKDEVDARNLRDSGTESNRTDARNCFYPFIVKDQKIIDIGDVPDNSFHPASANVELPDRTIQIWPVTDNGDEKKWRYARQSVESILFKLEPKRGRFSIQIIYNKDAGTMRSVWANARYDSSEYGSKLLDELIPGAGFTYPKSLWAVYDCVFSATDSDKDALVMDFFAGSS
jgi:adenine-specific DNA-methyltransferase